LDDNRSLFVSVAGDLGLWVGVSRGEERAAQFGFASRVVGRNWPDPWSCCLYCALDPDGRLGATSSGVLRWPGACSRDYWRSGDDRFSRSINNSLGDQTARTLSD